MNRRSQLATSLIGLLAASCATTNEPSGGSARLSFATPATGPAFPGGFRTLNGTAIADTPLSLELPPGRHTVGYWCPDHIVMDGPPTVTATFESSGDYVLHCHANEQGRVERR